MHYIVPNLHFIYTRLSYITSRNSISCSIFTNCCPSFFLFLLDGVADFIDLLRSILSIVRLDKSFIPLRVTKSITPTSDTIAHSNDIFPKNVSVTATKLITKLNVIFSLTVLITFLPIFILKRILARLESMRVTSLISIAIDAPSPYEYLVAGRIRSC